MAERLAGSRLDAVPSDAPDTMRTSGSTAGQVATTRDPGTVRVLYIAGSSYSGSTLLAFLLNTHPEVFTVSEMDGWNYGEAEEFRCSCGKILRECAFFQKIAFAFAENGLPFHFSSFGTRYSLVKNERLDRYLTEGVTRNTGAALERLRDRLVWAVPAFRKVLTRQDRANLVFIQTALAYRRARVFVDACKSPFRLRHLRRLPALDLLPVHLIRDPRGFALSNRVKWGWDAALSTRLWIRQQSAILRIAGEFRCALRVHYETLCEDTETTVAMIHRFAGLAPWPIPANFRAVDHHILGNVMRLSDVGSITVDTRWHHELSDRERDTVERIGLGFIRTWPRHPLSDVLQQYLDGSIPSARRLSAIG